MLRPSTQGQLHANAGQILSRYLFRDVQNFNAQQSSFGVQVNDRIVINPLVLGKSALLELDVQGIRLQIQTDFHLHLPQKTVMTIKFLPSFAYTKLISLSLIFLMACFLPYLTPITSSGLLIAS